MAPHKAMIQPSSSTVHRVLVVDEEPTPAELLVATLRFAGIAVTPAATGALL